jgi:cytochrome P450
MFNVTEEATTLPLFPFARTMDAAEDTEGQRLLGASSVIRARLATGAEIWVALSYDTNGLVLTDPRFSRSATLDSNTPRFVLYRAQREMLPLMDPPEHTRTRRLVAKALIAHLADRMRSWIASVVGDLLDAMERAGSPADLVPQLVSPLSTEVTDGLLGIPVEDRGPLPGLLDRMLAPAGGSPADAADALQETLERMRKLVRARRERPEDDLITRLVEVSDEGERLTEQQVVSSIHTLLIAGHSTLRGQLGLSLLTLLGHPDQRDLLRRRPELMPNAVEELLRHVLLVRVGALVRIATEDLALGGRQIRAGESVIALYHVADRDPEMFVDPTHLDFARENASRHLGFGAGRHSCLGVPLARATIEITIGSLLHRFPALDLDRDRAVAFKEGVIRTLRALPVRW